MWDTSFDSLFYADFESVLFLGLKGLFEFENRWIPSEMPIGPVKTTFVNTDNEREKTDTSGVEGWYDQ